ncbi:ATP synthase F1 subunit delta [Solitalea longa]|uniref:ATP synthase subunit delta n=1 Tax=Solitalea longa TaxID=2079460 RepID=A0A2S4ZXJ3_9SPHI|nr:ATP synthase F1 subunit delta [Solitalea longa]POY35081.1 ATP synthase F1 subunit delta [Solitalea longa]
MSEIKVALRYAKALLDLAIEQNKVEAINNDMKLFHQTVKANSELRAVLANPIVAPASKKKILNSLFTDKVDNVTITFFNLMVAKGREEYLYTTAKQFAELYNLLKGIVKAEIVSASALTEGNKIELIANLEKELGKQVILKTKVDPDLVGGFVLTVGDKQFDTSIAKQLRTLKNQLVSKGFAAQI